MVDFLKIELKLFWSFEQSDEGLFYHTNDDLFIFKSLSIKKFVYTKQNSYLYSKQANLLKSNMFMTKLYSMCKKLIWLK